MSSVSFETVKDTLTGEGHIPLECCFTVAGVIYRWGSTSRLKALRIEDNDLYQACYSFLFQQGREFTSFEEAIEVATRDKWPNWEKLPRMKD